MGTGHARNVSSRSLAGALKHFTTSWGRIALSMAVALGLGWLSPIGPGGGLVLASAAALHDADHGPHGGHHGPPPLGRDDEHHSGRELAGNVTAIVNSSEFTLATRGHTTVDVYVSSSTRYLEPGAPKGTVVSFGDLAVGDRVQVKGTQAGAGAMDATVVRIPAAYVVGTVQAVTSSEITLSPGRSMLTSTSATIVANVSASTVFKDPGVSSPGISDVLPGDVVKIFGTQKGVVPGPTTTLEIDATVVFIPLVSYVGVVSNLGSSGFSLTANSSTVTVQVTATTKYQVRGVTSPTLSNVANGEVVRVTGNQEGKATFSATLVRVLSDSHLRTGHHDHDDGHGPAGGPRLGLGRGGLPGKGTGPHGPKGRHHRH
jgi:hypothetical protein